MTLSPHQLKLVLVEPQIAPNTGNIGRLCVATGTALHLVRPLGFVLSDRQLKRSAMDYWDRLQLTVHDDLAAFLQATPQDRPGMWFFSSKGTRSFWEAEFSPSDWLIFGSETHGLPQTLVKQNVERTLTIPQVSGERCLNLATAAGIGLFEALRQVRP